MPNTPNTAAGEQGPTWSLWNRTSRETQGQPLGVWSWSYRGPEAHYAPTEKEKLSARSCWDRGISFWHNCLSYTGCSQEASPTHHIASARWSKWVALITQGTRTGKPYFLGILDNLLEEIMNWTEGRDFGTVPEKVTCAQEAPPHELSENERGYGSWENVDTHLHFG